MPEVKGFKYAYSNVQIEKMLKKVRDTRRPAKLTIQYVQKTWVLKNAQYSSVIDILKGMDFLDSSGVPKPLYAKYQNPTESKKTLAQGILNLYPSLSEAYSDPCSLSNDDLKGIIKEQTGADPSVVQKMVTTFRKLCSLADFGEINTDKKTIVKESGGEGEKNRYSIPIAMNIQIVIPADATANQYDKIFSSIKKNFGNNSK